VYLNKKEIFMKNGTWRLIILGLVLMTLVSCVSISDRTIPRGEMGTVEVLGKVETTSSSWSPFPIINKVEIKQKAYSRLLDQAQNVYGKNVDVKNIQISVSIIPTPAIGGFQKIAATGDVILLEQTTTSQSRSRVNRANATGIEKAIYTVSDDLINDLPANSKIAVINISSNNRDTSALVVDELEFHLVSARRFTIVDRRTLDTIRVEQNFQMSGDVSDASAVSIGQMLGANIVITGSITGTGTNQRLSIKALDVKTAQIVTMVRETF
jgi:hypothetical protein